jgi:hypothetical protein
MLALDSPEWVSLRHAYGAASDTPALLRALPTAPVGCEHAAEPWHSLWSSLCHQNDVYPASFAAVPHIVEAASTRPASDRLEYLHLAAYIECCRHTSRAPAVPSNLRPAYDAALLRGAHLTEESLRTTSTESSFQALLGCLAAFRGFPELGAGVLFLERELDCPHCGRASEAPGFDHYS